MTGVPHILLRAVFERAHRTLQRPLLMISIQRNSGGDFDVISNWEDLRLAEIEASALDMLRWLQNELATPNGCPDCAERKERVDLAVRALEQAFPDRKAAH